MNPTTACRASALVAHGRSECISFLSVAKKDSATALSWQEPVRPAERRTPRPSARSAMSLEVYRAPRSEWKIAPPATYPRAHAASSAATASPAVILSDIDQPTTIRVARSMTAAR